MLAAGFPHTAAASSVNRFCSSGLKAVQDIANQISTGSIEVGIAIGAESMSEGGDRLEKPFHDEILKTQEAADCMQPMIQTSENVGKDFNITRLQQDTYATESFRRAEVAQKAGWFDDEIVPITTKVKNAKGEWQTVTLTRDEGPRYGTTLESLGKIRPAMPQFGDKTTGGNASQVTDGGICYISISVSSHTDFILSSCRHPPHEAQQGHRAWPAHHGQILRCYRRWRPAPHHGYWPLSCYSKAPCQVPAHQR